MDILTNTIGFKPNGVFISVPHSFRSQRERNRYILIYKTKGIKRAMKWYDKTPTNERLKYTIGWSGNVDLSFYLKILK